MKVYRLCDEEEFETVMSTKSFQEVGKECKNNRLLSNHNYQPGRKYLHFFKDFGSLFYFYVREGTYICTCDIPDDILEQYAGIGKYLDQIHMRNYERVTEYAIPSDEMDFSFVSKMERVTESIDTEDYLFGEYTESLETVYEEGQKPQELSEDNSSTKEGIIRM